MNNFDSPDDLLQDAVKRKPGEEMTLTVRELVRNWGWERRGVSVVHQIRRDLERYDLTTDPNFEFGWIDNHVRIVPLARENGEHSSAQIAENLDHEIEDSLKVGVIESAVTETLVSVEFNSSLELAQSLMIKNNFSQLPVMKGKREIVGAISWESIAIAKMHNPNSTFRDCLTAVHVVKVDDDLFPLIPEIIKRGYIFVVNQDKTISGIVTSADISEEFLAMAGPFLLVGECERRLRTICSSVFSLDQIRSAKHSDDDSRIITGPEDLTFGEASRLFESQEIWESQPWQTDRSEFLKAPDEVRKIRNEIMHFSTDDISPNDKQSLDNLLRWLTAIVKSLPKE